MNNDLKTRAKEIIEKHGKNAVEVAKRKVAVFSKVEDSREKDIALMLLTEVENLINN